ncbi:Pyrophosphate--fructose 6-phosphate 1-phosphotransferase subunit beta [Hibiscus syriacus]|uniref:Pyrophosphate--fructose 6-phosphate 1-phosphotransferase subunit beta n=1 Tax=Hibiscus syriacus TaxID=106335 RepID=A0A6A3D121_HIBSY|nr:Pyrophosphate--fructose 6-phosphate 1-phosphotransferase subunit beta [Hibiscus syriacus]
MSDASLEYSNGGAAAFGMAPVSGRLSSVYSQVQTSRIDHALPLPSVLRNPFKIVDGPPSSAAGNPDEIAKLFPNLFGQRSAMLVPNEAGSLRSDMKLKVGVDLSGGQAPGGHNVISGIFVGETRSKLLISLGKPNKQQRSLTWMGLWLLVGMTRTQTLASLLKTSVVRLMGRAASHITLECALQTHPNITIIGEEVAAKKETFKNVTDYMVQWLIAELNESLAHKIVDEDGLWKRKLTEQSLKLFEFLPPAIQEQLMLERDPHGNVQVAKIETEKMLIQMVETELEKRKLEGSYKGHFKGQSHFFGYEGRCGLPTNFDASYCYALGYAAGAVPHSGKTGLISSVGNLAAPVDEWTVGGTALTSLMDVERRHGKFKPVIKKAMVELDGAPFKKFASMREDWALKNRYISPGPIQFVGPASNAVNHTLLLELGAQS